MRALAFVVLAACSNDPLYIPAPSFVDGDGMTPAQTSLQIPIRTERPLEAMQRVARTGQLGVDVPYVKVGDIEVSVEWKVTNLTDQDGAFEIQLNGANEYFAYDPVAAAVGLDEDEPQPPGLGGDIPIRLAKNASLTGLFREDELREASIDLDQITRGNVNAFRATLTVSKNAKEFAELAPQTFDANGDPEPQMTTGVVYPREAFAQIVRVDLVFKPDRPMRLEYTVRVRDNRGILHELLDAAMTEAPGELQTFDPAVYTPPAPP